MSDLLSIGTSGLSAYRSALAAIGDNVANAEVAGYSRRTVMLGEVRTSGSPMIGQGEGIQFNGVKAKSVDRLWDQFQAADARLSSAISGRADSRMRWLTAVENTLVDGPRGVGQLITNFFNAGVQLAANPKDPLSRGAMLAALDEATGAIRSTAEGMNRVIEGIGATAQLEVEGVNADLASLTDVNIAIRQAEPGRTSRASLEDERDRLIDKIANRIDVTATIADDGTATLTLAQQASVTLLDIRTRGLVIVQPASDGRLSLQLSANGATSPLPASGGTLAGLVDVAASTSDKRATLEALAAKFTADVNSWSAQGIDANGNPGAPMLAMPVTATSLAMIITDPKAIAAASATAENGNLLDLNALRGPDGAEARWAALVSGQAQSLAGARAEAAAASTRRDNSFAARDEVSGIDLDREAADLMRYQQAYGASAKIIQVARETIQSILDLF